MRNWGLLGLTFGLLSGGLIAMLLMALAQPLPLSPAVSPPAIPPDVSVFVSEQTLSRLASEQMNRPVMIDFDEFGQMRVTIRTPMGRLNPVVEAEIILEMQGSDVVSELRWVRLGYLTIPARWFPPQLTELTALIGQTVETQTPPNFSLVGLTTTPTGLYVDLKWVGQ